MSLIKKIDVDKHFAAKRAARSVTARMSTVVSSAPRTSAPDPIKNAPVDHSSLRAPVTSIAIAAESGGNQASTVPGNRQS